VNRCPWQPCLVAQKSTKFVHLFTFEDERAHQRHGQSGAVRQFESVYQSELVGGPVVFTDYQLVATNGGTTR